MPKHCLCNCNSTMPQTRLQMFISAVNPSQRTSEACWAGNGDHFSRPLHSEVTTGWFIIAFCATGPISSHSPLRQTVVLDVLLELTDVRSDSRFTTTTAKLLWSSCSFERTEGSTQEELWWGGRGGERSGPRPLFKTINNKAWSKRGASTRALLHYESALIEVHI